MDQQLLKVMDAGEVCEWAIKCCWCGFPLSSHQRNGQCDLTHNIPPECPNAAMTCHSKPRPYLGILRIYGLICLNFSISHRKTLTGDGLSKQAMSMLVVKGWTDERNNVFTYTCTCILSLLQVSVSPFVYGLTQVTIILHPVILTLTQSWHSLHYCIIMENHPLSFM